MLFAIPIKVEDSKQHVSVPIANGVLVVANVLLYWGSGYLYVGPDTGPFSVITYAFAHAGWVHLLGNMWLLLLFGNAVNRRMGNGYYLLMYFGTVLAMGVFVRLMLGVEVVGASGALFAVIAVYLLLMPASTIEMGFVAVFPITILVGLFKAPESFVGWFIRWSKFGIRAWWCLLLVPLMELWGIFWWGSFWSHMGHLLGLLCGVAAVLLLPTSVTMPRRSTMAA